MKVAWALVMLVGCAEQDAVGTRADASVSGASSDVSVASIDVSSVDASADGTVDGTAPEASCPGMDGGSGDARVPANHRAASSACPTQRGPGAAVEDGPFVTCDADVDCTMGANGRCVDNCGVGGCPGLGTSCDYDHCFSDSDCEAGVPCICRPSADSGAQNLCIGGGNCAVDSDCGPGGYCSLNAPTQWCGGRYFCHTPCDECLDDSDCPTDVPCMYFASVGYWSCKSCGPPPPGQ
jgi:hypothetical protein